MCLAKIFIEKDDKNPVLENVITIIPEKDGVMVETLFGERRILQGRITKINFTDSRVTLKTG